MAKLPLSIILSPPTKEFQGYTTAIVQFLQRVSNVWNNPDNGATAARPTTSLSEGQFYFDTTLGKPIWRHGSNWVDATGTIV